MADDEVPGWDAIDRVLDRLYSDQEPLHSGTIVKWMMGGPDPIDGISAYRNELHQPHWHFVTYGYSELYSKESPNADVSGYGLEMTFRLARATDEAQPPTWAFNFLQNLARYVFETGNVFKAGHHINLNGPIAVGHETEIRAAIFADDPELPTIDTPHGRVEFLQVVGITLDERESALLWNTTAFTEILREKSPLLITDVQRSSIRSDPMISRRLAEGSRKEGSHSTGSHVSSLDWEEKGRGSAATLELHLGALVIRGLAPMLAARLPHGHDFRLSAPERSVCFRPAKVASWKLKDQVLTICLTPSLVEAIQQTLVPKRGTYSWDGLERFILKIVPSEIKDSSGKVVEVIG
jgi:suppressor of fused